MVTAQEVFDAAPLGALVKYTDGTPKPPPHHKKKLSAWKTRNSAGYLVEKKPGDPSSKFDRPGFMLSDQSHGWIVINSHFSLNSDKSFEITPPKPGTILGYGTLGGRIEVRHIWPSLDDAYSWASAKSYDLLKCGLSYLIINEDGTQTEYTPPPRGWDRVPT